MTEPPAELDYKTWLGPSRQGPYIGARVYMNWRWNYNVGGGQLLDWIGHHCDIAHWGLDMDQTGGPLEIESSVGEFPPANAVWNTCTKYRITLKYPKDITLLIAGGHGDIRDGTKWIGTDGWVWVDRGRFDASNLDWRANPPPTIAKCSFIDPTTTWPTSSRASSPVNRRSPLSKLATTRPSPDTSASSHCSPGTMKTVNALVED